VVDGRKEAEESWQAVYKILGGAENFKSTKVAGAENS
jgi:hypothetical protein